MKKNLIKYLLSLSIIILVVVILDIAAGFVLDYLWRAIPVSQDMGKGQYARNEVETDLVVIGSSRAAHHYDANMLTDSLGMTAYNLGMDGCFFLDNCCVIHSLINRYSPKILILEISSDAMFADSKNHMANLYNYYWNDKYVREIVNHEEGCQIQLKLLSSLYHYNANSFKTIGYGLKGIRSGKGKDSLNGFIPIKYKEKIHELKLQKGILDPSNYTLSEWKENLLLGLLKTTSKKGIKVYLVTSPRYAIQDPGNQKSVDVIDRNCKLYGTKFWDFSAEKEFLKHPEWFKDGSHLNEIGAKVFTELIIKRIKTSSN